ncbi:reverse transcriptase domain-containing protein [Tanacetum coccineum]
MMGVPWHIAEHRLNIREGCLPIRKKKRGKRPERNKAIQKKWKTVDVGIMKERPQSIPDKQTQSLDFIVERPDEESPNELMAKPEELPEPWTVAYQWVNPSIDRFRSGLLLTNPDGFEFHYAKSLGFEAKTNNEAEYEALIAGVSDLRQMAIKNLQSKCRSPSACTNQVMALT